MIKNKIEATNRANQHQPCNHPILVKESAYGGKTGNFICMQCECLVSAAVNPKAWSSQNYTYLKRLLN